MPFGLTNAPATFERLMTFVFSGLIGNSCLAYIDDIIIYGATFQIHLVRMKQVFQRLRESSLKIKPEKCHFAIPKAKFLGHVVSDAGLATAEEKISKLKSGLHLKTLSYWEHFLDSPLITGDLSETLLQLQLPSTEFLIRMSIFIGLRNKRRPLKFWNEC